MTTQSDSNAFIVDSSGWIEYIAGGSKASTFANYIESQETLLLPSIVVYEVYKKLWREKDKHTAEHFYSQTVEFGDRVIPLTLELAVLASRTSLKMGLPMADAIIYATADHCRAQLITSDSHFANLDGVTMV